MKEMKKICDPFGVPIDVIPMQDYGMCNEMCIRDRILAAVLAIVIGFLLCADKAHYWDAIVHGLAPVSYTHLIFGKENITVYAAWGFDEDGNGTADVLEDWGCLLYTSRCV